MHPEGGLEVDEVGWASCLEAAVVTSSADPCRLAPA